ncbi:MAG TPA: sulfatase-like hydrolase/transferase [Bacillota bacterium]|jgi:hypothetical protein|nr:LTA synthase family protein [Fastidiosipila sp.]HPX92899.1 sulfatase-like hydrolase/transferase [Bacillota bacterium]HQB80711.1 sulfatase-like hydrolase/transferase [Bacillota bacterium]
MRRKIPAIILLLTGLFLARSQTVQAYIDPATTTYLIQIVSALVITLGVTAGIFFNRIRLFFLNFRVSLGRLWIRLFAKRDRLPVPADRTLRTGANEKIDKVSFLWADRRSFRERLLSALPAAASLCFTFFVFGIFELYAGNLEDMTFSFGSLVGPLILIASAGTVLIALASALLRGRLFDLTLSLLLGLGLSLYVQANFLNAGLGRLTGDAVAWEEVTGKMAANLTLWTLLILLPLLVRFLSGKTWRRLAFILPLILVGTQLITAIFSYAGEPGLRKDRSDSYLSRQGIYEVADGNNIIVFILDRLDNRFLDLVESDDPHFFDRLDGFTRFTNNTSRYSQTFPSVTESLTGVPYDFKEGYRDYLKRAWREGSFIPGLKEAGFTCKLYLTPSQAYDEARDLSLLADNLAKGRPEIDTRKLLASLIRLNAYRSVPLALKPFYWTGSQEFSQLTHAAPGPAPYELDDPLFYDGLLNQGLKVTADSGNFIFLHLNGSHPPFTMDEQAQRVQAGNSSYLLQTKGCFHILYEYLDQLKAVRQYAGSTIIITGDHGARSSDVLPPEAAMVTGLFVKPAGREGSPLEFNEAPVSSDNFRATVCQAAGLDQGACGPGYFELAPDQQLPRYVYHRLFPSGGKPGRLLIYRILGDAGDFNNWQLAGEEILP